MSVISSVYISGFWGDREVGFDLDGSVNFLIGQNGSGKTTAINLIAAAMTGDIESLERLPFETILISLYDQQTRRRPSIEVTKEKSEHLPYHDISYAVKETAKGPETLFPIIRGEPNPRFRPRSRIQRAHHIDLINFLGIIAPVSWLSIHRTTASRDPNERPFHDYTVDQKIQEINERLVRYFSELSVLASSEIRDFQRKLFLSLIEVDDKGLTLDTTLNQDFEADRDALVEIYKRFEVPESQYRKRTQKFFGFLRELSSRSDRSTYTLPELVTMLNSWRIHSLVQEWNITVNKEKQALQPRDAFVGILNRMFHRKRAEILDNNDLHFSTTSDKNLSTFDLSSGEKQLYIIFAEALLQRGKPCIYIADEPELSLHINWQEVLVNSLRELNPRSQIVFATHSPDIVSHYSDNVIDMEGIVN